MGSGLWPAQAVGRRRGGGSWAAERARRGRRGSFEPEVVFPFFNSHFYFLIKLCTYLIGFEKGFSRGFGVWRARAY